MNLYAKQTFKKAALACMLASAWCTPAAWPQTPPAPAPAVTRDLVYGHQDGLALVMDVIVPVKNPLGKGLLYMVSGGLYSGRGMADSQHKWLQGLADRSGYTLFVIMHGSQPRYTCDEIFPQICRAVRFVRANAAQWAIDPQHLGIMGTSSGGWLSLMAGLNPPAPDPQSADPIDHVSAQLQAVVAFFPPTDFLNYGDDGAVNLGTGPLEPFRPAFFHGDPPVAEQKAKAKDFSPITHVGPQDAPLLLIHGEKDALVPVQQSRLLKKKADQAGLECTLVIEPEAGHDPALQDKYMQQVLDWLGQHLCVQPTQQAAQGGTRGQS